MTPPIDRRILVRQLLSREPSSGLAKHLTGQDPARLTKTMLEGEVGTYASGVGSRLSSKEAAMLQHLHGILAAPSLFEIIDPALGELCELTKVKPLKKRRGAKGGVPAFTQLTSPRIVRGGEATGTEKAWTKNLGSQIYAQPVLSPDGAELYALAQGGMLHAYDRATGKQQWTLQLENYAYATPAVSPDGKTLFCATGYYGSGKLTAVDAETHKKKWEKAAGASNYLQSSPALSPDGTRVFFACSDNQFRAFDAETGDEVWSAALNGCSQQYGSPVVSADGSKVFFADRVKTVHAYDALTGEELWQATRNGLSTVSGALSPDGQTLYYPANNGVHAFDVETGAEKWVRAGMNLASQVGSLVPTSDGTTLLAPDAGGFLYALDTEEGSVLWSVKNPRSYALTSVALNVDETVAICLDNQGCFFTVNLEDETVEQKKVNSDSVYGGFAMSPDGQWGYFGSYSSNQLKAVKLEK